MSYCKSVEVPVVKNGRSTAGRRLRANFLPMGGMLSAGRCAQTSLREYRDLLAPYDAAMMQWLQDDANALAFYNDPLAAFQKATGAPAEVIEQLKGVQIAPEALDLPQPEAPGVVLASARQAAVRQVADMTEGWDLVIGMDHTAVNQVLQYVYDQGLLPHTLSGAYEVPLKGYDKVAVEAGLAAPTLSDGTGNNVTVCLHVSKGTLDLTGDKPISGVDITGLEFYLTVNLVKFQSPVQPEEGNRYDFYLDIADASAFVGFRIENIPVQLAAYEILLELALLALLRTTFSGKRCKLFTADLNGAGDYAFLIPQEINYAGQSSAGEAPALGALLTTSGGHRGAVQLNADLFPRDAQGKRTGNSALAMSRDLFLSNIGISSFASAFHEETSTFAYHTAGHYVYNVKEFDYFEKVKGYTVRIRSAILKIENGELTLDLQARVTPSAGLYLDYTVHAPYQASIRAKEGVGQEIHFELDKENYQEDSSASAEWWVWLLAVLALVIGAVILAIILAIIDAAAPEIGADVFEDALHDVDWNYLNIAELKTIEMGDCIRIGCNAVFGSGKG